MGKAVLCSGAWRFPPLSSDRHRVDSPAGACSTHHTGSGPQVAAHQPPRPFQGTQIQPR